MILATKRMHLPPKQALSEDEAKVKTILELPPKQASSEDEAKVKMILELPPKQTSSKDTDDAMEVDDQTEQLWMKIEDVQLTEADKFIVTEVVQLSDKHINAVQKLLQANHPNLKGMCSTLVAGRRKLPPSGLQAFFVRSLDCSIYTGLPLW